MPTADNSGAGTRGSPGPGEVARGRRELVVIAAAEAGLRVGPAGARSLTGQDVDRLSEITADQGVGLHPLFGPEDRLIAAARAAGTGYPQGDGATPDGAALPVTAETAELLIRMARCYSVDAPDDRLDALAEELGALDVVEAAYVKPAAELATVADTATGADLPAAPYPAAGAEAGINDMAPTGPDAPPASPDFTARQGYLGAAPGGIDARYAWTVPGGRGGGARVIDCEWGWRFTHEDLLANQGGIVAGTGSTDLRSVNHGTAVLGEIGGDVNTIGVTGICPDAVTSASAFSVPSATAIKSAADRLGLGDIILLEIHRAGPRFNFQARDDQLGYVAVEWWPDDYLAIRYAINRGTIVVEAAGNGAENLDDGIYDTRPAGFPAWWRNPFRRNPFDSGAVLAGAGAPPPNTHGRDHGPDRSRLGFSNFGACLDAQGWGREVTTTGYGNLQGGADADLWYTDTFSGTSSASPIVVGALGCVQGVLRAQGRPRLSPARARELLRATGSPQQDAPARPATQRIGNRPDLRRLIPAALQSGTWVGVQFTGTVPAGATRRWFTFNWPAHWHVIWTVMPTSPRPGAPQVRWRVRVERAGDRHATYWIDVTNVSSAAVDFEARYAVLGW